MPPIVQHRRGTFAALTAANETPSAGEIYFETDTNKLKVGDGTASYNLLPYIVSGSGGGGGSGSAANSILNSLAFNGSTTTFSLVSGSTAVTPANAASLLIVLNGVVQQPGVAYTVSGSQIVFLSAPAATDTFFGVHLAGGSGPDATTSVKGVVIVGTGLSVSSGTVSVAYGTSSTTACVGNDSRLSDSRSPLSHAHGNITNAGAIGSTSGRIVVTTTSGVLTTAASISTSQVSGLGTLATQSGTFSGTSSGTNTGDQTIQLTGDVTGSGTGSFAATLSTTGVAAGTYTSVTVDAKGRVTAGSNPAISYSTLAGVPSTFAPSSHTHTLSDLAQSGATTGQVAQWDGTAWVAATVSSGSSSASSLTNGTLADERLSANAQQAITNLLHPFLLAGM
jgi:hypothetical protein